MKTKPRAAREAKGLVRQVSGPEKVTSYVYSVVQVAAAFERNVNTVRAEVRGRPYRVPLSGRTTRGHRGFTFFDVLLLSLGRKATAYGVRPAAVQKMIDGLLALAQQPLGAAVWNGLLLVGNDVFEFLSVVDLANKERNQAFNAKLKAAGPHILVDTATEVRDAGEHLSAMLDNRPYVEPEEVREARERKSESFKRTLMEIGKLTKSVRQFTSDAVLAGGLPPYRAALVGLMSQSLNDSTVEKLIGIIEAKFIDRVPKDRRDGSLCFVNVNHDEPECLFVPYGEDPGHLSKNAQVFVLPWGTILDVVDKRVEVIAEGLVEAKPEPIKRT
jgi:hypothetical protein